MIDTTKHVYDPEVIVYLFGGSLYSSFARTLYEQAEADFAIEYGMVALAEAEDQFMWNEYHES